MNIQKCNRCKKLIKNRSKDGVSVLISGSEYVTADLCVSCATPFLRNFKKHARLSLVEKKLGIVSGK